MSLTSLCLSSFKFITIGIENRDHGLLAMVVMLTTIVIIMADCCWITFQGILCTAFGVKIFFEVSND